MNSESDGRLVMLDENVREYFSPNDSDSKMVRHEPYYIPRRIWPCAWRSTSKREDNNIIIISFLRFDGEIIRISLDQPSAHHLKETLDEFINPQTTNHGNKAEHICERIDAAIESITHTIDGMNQTILRLVGPPPSEPHNPQSHPVAGCTPDSPVKP